MADAETEQNKSEEATPFKLKRAREKGNVARGADLGFFAMLAGFALFALVAGASMIRLLAESMRHVILMSPALAADPQQTPALLGAICVPLFQSIALLGGTIVLVVALFEIVQVRGLVFSLQPLKPDFNRLNPGKGLKRLFSVRMLKETLKNVIKLAVYSLAAYFTIRTVFDSFATTIVDAPGLSRAMDAGGMRLLFVFVLLALIFAGVDQVIVRGDFRKQMRMSRRELTREVKDREGEPRIKRRRKQLHAEFAKQARSLGDLRGSDMLVVNPEHYAVGLVYDAETMSAPRVTAKGRNNFALLLKRRATSLSLTIFESPQLARSLYKHCEKGEEVTSGDYGAVVDLYLKLARSGWRNPAERNA